MSTHPVVRSRGFLMPIGPDLELSNRIVKHFPEGYVGRAAEVGAADGLRYSPTFGLEKQYGWRVLCVEPNPEFAPKLRTNRAQVDLCACGKEDGEAKFHANLHNPEAYSSLKPTGRTELFERDKAVWDTFPVKVRTLDSLLEKWDFPQLDVLSIDTEGTEMDVLEGFDIKRWNPLLLLIESWDEGGPITAYMESKGYRKIDRRADNNIYIREDK